MLETIINAIKAKLEENGAVNVYSAFDNAAIESLKKSLFTVVDISAFESSAPIYSLYTVYIPYRAETEIRVTAPEYCSMTHIYRYYDKFIGAAAAGFKGTLKGMTVKFDSNIRRLVLTARLSLSGIIRSERSVN